MRKGDGVLSDQQVMALVEAALRGTYPVSKDDLARLLQWANGVMVDWAMVTLLLEGRASIDCRGDDPGEWAWHTLEQSCKDKGAVRRDPSPKPVLQLFGLCNPANTTSERPQ